MNVRVEGNNIVLKTSYEDRDFAYSLGAKWDYDKYEWTLPLTLMNAYRLTKELGYAPSGIKEFLEKFDTEADVKMPKIKEPFQLFDYQQKCLRRIANSKRFGVFFDMGTGKTLLSIALSSYIYEKQGSCLILIVCPLSVITPVWEKQVGQFCVYPYRIIKLTGSTKLRNVLLEKTKAFKDRINFAVINYDSLRLVRDKLLEMKFDACIFDESTRIKNKDTKVTKCAIEIADKCDGYVLDLTGTPISVNVADIFSQARVLSPNIFGQNYWKFCDRFAYFGGFENKVIVGTKNKEELYEILQKFSMTIKKKDAGALPEITYETRNLEMAGEQLRVYEKAKKEFDISCLAVEGKDWGGVVKPKEHQILIKGALSRLVRCQQITSGHTKNDEDNVIYFPENVKLKETLDIIRDSRPQKVVIFSRFLEDLRILNEEINKLGVVAKTYSGETPAKVRDEILKQFDEDKIDVLLVQVQTGGIGLDLSKASICIHYNLWYSFAVYDQANSRLHRKGQKNNVLVIHLICEKSIDEDVYNIVKNRVKLSDYFFGKKLENIKIEELEE